MHKDLDQDGGKPAPTGPANLVVSGESDGVESAKSPSSGAPGEPSPRAEGQQDSIERLRAERDAMAAEKRAAIEESDRLRDLFRNAPDPYLVTDPEGRIAEANLAAAGLLATADTELMGKPLRLFLPLNRRKEFEAELATRLITESDEEWILELAPRRGATVPVSARLRIARDRSGGAATVRWILRPVREGPTVSPTRRSPAPDDEAGRVLDHLPDGFVTLGTDWKLTYVNAAAERLFGLERHVMLGAVLWELVPKLAGSRIEKALRRSAVESIPTYVEDRIGEAGAWIALRAYPSSPGVSAHLEEIGERKAIEAERERLMRDLVSERSLLQSVLDQMPLGVIIADARSGRRLAQNRQATELIRSQVNEPGPPAYRGFRQDGSPYGLMDWPLERSLASGEVVVEEEIDFVNSGGERLVLRVSSAPVLDLRDRVLAAVATIRDVTVEQARAAEQAFLKEVSDLLGSSIDYFATVQAIAGLCVGRICEYCIVHVKRRGEFVAAGIAHRNPDEVETLRAMIKRAPLPTGDENPIVGVFRTGEVRLVSHVEADLLDSLTHDGTQREMIRGLGIRSAVVAPLVAGGKVLGAMSLVRTPGEPEFTSADLPLVREVARRAALAVDNARLFADARRSAESHRHLIQVVSHDLRSAIHVAALQTELLTSGLEGADDPALPKRLGTIQRTLGHMHSLTSDLLDLEKLEAGRFALTIDPMDPSKLCAEIEDMWAPAAEARSISIELVCAEEHAWIDADRVRLVQVLSNLVANAIQHTPEGGRVAIELGEGLGELVFRVRDSGTGIAPELLRRVFDRFWQGSPSASGSGLGLSIAKAIVKAHGGRIWAESDAGQGAVFTFTIPRQRRPPTASEPERLDVSRATGPPV